MTQVSFAERDYTLSTGVLRVRSGGAGRPLIHLHSAAGPRVSPVIECLAQSHRVHAPFMPGFEGMPAHPGVDSVQKLAGVVAEFITKECGGSCDVMGESFGGWIAMWLAILYPQTVGQLVLEAPAGLRPRELGGLPQDPAERFKKLHAHPGRAPKETRSDAVLAANRKTASALLEALPFDHALAERLGEIQSRTLVLIGTLDGIIPAESARLAKANIPHSHLTFIWDAAHALEFDQPGRVGALALDFLDRGESFLVKQGAA
ncbi:MAG: alpha/beta hydrolase [Alphaproteobacteria bacterium]|nr:alpha/beta hydrolase [Alphaproteobacteria bacterium]